jgi:hypothetical protein
MTKSNPLFVDSTKLYGDFIGTQIELRDVVIYDDETLHVVITNHEGSSDRVPMEQVDGGGYEARVRLSHQKAVTYQFVVEKQGRELLRSAIRQGRAQYAIIEKWEPLREPLRPPAELPRASDMASTAKSLIEKWGL